MYECVMALCECTGASQLVMITSCLHVLQNFRRVDQSMSRCAVVAMNEGFWCSCGTAVTMASTDFVGRFRFLWPPSRDYLFEKKVISVEPSTASILTPLFPVVPD